jgi:phage FluMu protein Com
MFENLQSGDSKGIVCQCSDCEEKFWLTADTDDVNKLETYLMINSCESGGIYGIKVKCPRCKFVHHLY